MRCIFGWNLLVGTMRPLVVLALLLSSTTPAIGAQPAALTLIPEALPGAPPLPRALRVRLAAELTKRGDAYEPRTKNLRPDGSPLYSNRLLLETSPYLLQHAHNPVNWYPWGEEAFAEAARSNRPILVSIGYSTCHWCHVMEEETFDSPERVRFLNEHFVAIKVDREARPDIDSIYMSAVHAMQQRGGWPLNVWLTPTGEPFFGGTYFPPEDRGGRRGFGTVLYSIHEAWTRDDEKITQQASTLAARLRSSLEGTPPLASRVPDESALELAWQTYSARVDKTWGGIGSGTKFPSSLPIRLLLRLDGRSGELEALAIATLTLEKMAAGGIHDHVGGGFHRYATDRRWLIPHFEKMLYDNALLAVAYLEAGQRMGREDFLAIARETLDYVAREMTAPGGAFYSATDADSLSAHSEPEEGWFFTWTPEEIEAVVGPKRAAAVRAWFGVTPGGTYEGRNILHTWREAQVVEESLGLEAGELARQLEESRSALYAARSQRSPPLRDDKILVAWNGLMISAFARAAFTLDEPRYLESAQGAARFVLDEMRAPDGIRLRRISLDGRAAGPAFLEDYAFLIAGLLDLYEAAPDPRWLREAIALQEVLDTHFSSLGAADSAPSGAYYRTADDGERLLAREKPSRDGALPSGNSVAALNLLRLAELTTNDAYSTRAALLFSESYDTLTRQPTSVAELLVALDFLLARPRQIVIVQPEDGGASEEMLAVLRRRFGPRHVRVVTREGPALDAQAELVPWVRGKRAIGGKTTAYVCVDRVCAYPTSDPETFAKQLENRR
jgi:uncharacterized protein YyaL (SSP411 family)